MLVKTIHTCMMHGTNLKFMCLTHAHAHVRTHAQTHAHSYDVAAKIQARAGIDLRFALRGGGTTAVELAKDTQTIEVLKAGGATMPEISDRNKNQLLIEFSKKGCTGGVHMVLQAGA
jgi:hypothetical protein